MNILSRVIKKKEIECEIKTYLKVRESSMPVLRQLKGVEGRYYTSPEVAFVFEKEDIDIIFSKYPNANALKGYYGAHSKECLEADGVEDGTPTIILVPCLIEDQKDGKKNYINLIKNEEDEGIEWPEGTSLADGTNLENFDIGNDNLFNV